MGNSIILTSGVMVMGEVSWGLACMLMGGIMGCVGNWPGGGRGEGRGGQGRKP